MFIEKKKIKGHSYYYLRESYREKGRVRTRTISYLGKSKKGLKQKIRLMVKEQEAPYGQTPLSQEQLQKIKEIKEDFHKKITQLDKRLIEDMFRDFKTHYIYNTNAIEGNTLTLQQTSLLLNENKTPAGKDLREIYDHLNERDTFDYLLQNKPNITINTILDLHARLLKDIDNRTGNFRIHNVRVIGASFSTSEAKYVETDMKLLLMWLHGNEKKLHPLILAALFHEKFERIHPFYDGNGRTGRMLLNLILLRHDLPPLIVPNKSRLVYYKALEDGHKAELWSSDPHHYQLIINFLYQQLIETHKRIFSKWGNT